MNKNCVIIGASHAGVSCAQKLRRLGWEGSITVLGEEDHTPYHRPPLSKDYLKGAKGPDAILLSSAAAYEKAQIEIKTDVRVDSIDRDKRCLAIADGSKVAFDSLVLATGARARKLPLQDAALPGVCYLRGMNDVDRIREHAVTGDNAVVIGGGYIGLEAAASLHTLGMSVTVLEALDRVLQRVTSEPVSDFFTRVHREEGVDIRTGTAVSALLGTDVIEAVQLSSGEKIAANLVIIGVGVVPNIELATAAGLNTENGICVDATMRTNDENIYAIGDCASFVHPRYDRFMRLESVQNANDQALIAAKSIVGESQQYDAIPWFWSDQYDVKLQIAGLAEGYDELLIRGEENSGRSMSVLYLKDKRLLAVDALNSPRDFVQGKKLIQEGAILDTENLSDPEVAIIGATVS